MKIIISTLIILIFPILVSSQERLILNDNVFLIISNNAKVVLDNSNPNAITLAGTGGNIVSEGERNQLVWEISNSTGNYIIPWTTKPIVQGGNGVKIPMEMNITSAGNAGGTFNFSTYETATDANTAYPTFPTAVTTMNGGSPDADQSLMVVDRFWILDNTTYTTIPDATLSFTYDDAANEIAGANTLTEANLQAQRWSIANTSWEGLLFGATNTATNITSGVSAPAADFWPVWVLVDQTVPLPVNFLGQEISNKECNNNISWKVSNETNCDYYEISRSFDGNKWEEIAIISGSGTSIGVIDYEYNDFTHFTNGLVYYQINQVDFNGKKYAFEKIISESVCSESEDPIIFPNPTKGSINIKTIKEGELKLYDVTGRIVLNEILLPTVNTFELSNFSKGIYTSHIKLGLKEYIQKILID